MVWETGYMYVEVCNQIPVTWYQYEFKIPQATVCIFIIITVKSCIVSVNYFKNKINTYTHIC
jgi:hypothetical protein